MEKLDYLIEYLLKENKNIKLEKIPSNIIEKKNLYRSLCNIREANPINLEYIQIENEYLQEELCKKKITKVENIKTIAETIKQSNLKSKDKICLWQGDITTIQIEAIVNAGNSQGLGCFVPCHKCIDNAIHSFAGISLRLECDKIMKNKQYNLKTSEVIITNGYNLPAKNIIHTVGTIIYDEVNELKKNELKKCYINCLKIAIKNGIKTIAFPCISTGEFRFPKELACKIAIEAVDGFVEESKDKLEKVVFNVFSKEDFETYEEYIRTGKTNKRIDQ